MCLFRKLQYRFTRGGNYLYFYLRQVMFSTLLVCLFVCLSVCRKHFDESLLKEYTCPKDKLIKFWFNLDGEWIRYLQKFALMPSRNYSKVLNA